MTKSAIGAMTLAMLLAGAPAAHAQSAPESFVIEAAGGETMTGERRRFSVPENRRDAQSRLIELGYVRLPATTNTPGNPIVYLAGGPGGSATGTARGARFAFFQRLREVGDVILFDQRGTGLSPTMQSCATANMIDFSQTITRETMTQGFVREFGRCVEIWRQAGVDIAGYTTAESAADLEDLRIALGAERLDLVAISYGTHLGMAAMRQGLPVGRAVFTGLEGPDQTVKLPAHFDAFLDRVDTALAADARAGAVYPGLREMMASVHARLDAEPTAVELEGATGETVVVRFDSFPIRLLAGFLFISDPERVARLPGFYAEMAMGSYERAAGLLYQGLGQRTRSLGGMSQLMDRASGISPERLTLVERQSQTALLGDAGNFPMPHALAALPEIDLGDNFRSAFVTDTPTLIVMGTMDGRTPIESQQEVAPYFANGTVLTVANGGHNIFEQSEALQAEIATYLRTGAISRSSIELPPVSFFVPD